MTDPTAAPPAVIEVLLVEDDPGDVLMTREAFEEHKLRNTLHVVTDGVEALAFLRREGDYADAPRPDLILLDLNLPRKDGREVLAEIKADADAARPSRSSCSPPPRPRRTCCAATSCTPTRTSPSRSTSSGSSRWSGRSTTSSSRVVKLPG